MSSDGRRRGMTVLDRTRLTDRLSTSFSSPRLYDFSLLVMPKKS
jgi:hypothetical protein